MHRLVIYNVYIYNDNALLGVIELTQYYQYCDLILEKNWFTIMKKQILHLTSTRPMCN
jgi:hypothetical protein